MKNPTPFQLAMIGAQLEGETPLNKAEAALKLWDKCESLLYKRKKLQEECSIFYEEMTEQEWSEQGKAYPRKPDQLSMDDFLRKFHPRRDKSVGQKRKDYQEYLYCKNREAFKDTPLKDREATAKRLAGIQYGIALGSGIKSTLGNEFIQWYKDINSQKKSINGRKGVVAKRLKRVQKTVK